MSFDDNITFITYNFYSLRFEFWALNILAPSVLVIVIDAILSVNNWVPIIHFDTIPGKCIEGLVNLERSEVRMISIQQHSN